MIETYDWAGGSEACLRFGPDDGPVVVAALPLFEEANRTRAFTVAILRALGEHDVGALLPDLPGTGESLLATEHATLADWRAAYASAVKTAGYPAFAFAIRGGALIDCSAAVEGRYHFAPANGSAIVRELVRARQASAREDGDAFDPAMLDEAGAPIELAGNRLSRTLIAELKVAEPATTLRRVVRLESDAQPADRKLPGAPLWRRAEPDTDGPLAALIAADIADWVHACGA
ncbi:hypothetical protein [Sphingomonas japonica]|uniref:Uncharacterized protein n=1 Tax=Sphingomonas japonica TaxID=511662 RepID=A0ABX0U8A8_9SPHN|nr:hypothetical protein [Sphingomonas japonica]NIJ25037.1 hypothetical protein [Sphingomonas japonica]